MYFFYFLTKTYVVGTQKNCLNVTALFSTHKKCMLKLMGKQILSISTSKLLFILTYVDYLCAFRCVEM